MRKARGPKARSLATVSISSRARHLLSFFRNSIFRTLFPAFEAAVHLRIHQPVFSYPRQLLPSPRRISWRCYTPSTQRNRPCSSSYQYFSWYFYPAKVTPATPLQPPQILVMAMSRRSLLLSIHLLSVSSSRISACL